MFPAGWTDRRVDTLVADPERGRTYIARCAAPHDLRVAKLIAGRPKDRTFVAALLAARRVSRATIADLLAETDLSPDERDSMLIRLAAWAARG